MAGNPVWFYRDRFYLVLIIVGTIICLTPLFFLNERRFTIVSVDPHSFLPLSFMVVIIPAADLILELPSYLTACFYPKKKSTINYVDSTVVIRLTDSERLLFIIGVALPSVVFFLPNSMDITMISVVNSCTNNCNVLLTVVPITIFLRRCTTTFTHRRTSALINTLVIGLIFYTVSYYFDEGSNINKTLALVGNIFVTISVLLFLFVVMLCIISYWRQKMGTTSIRAALLWLTNSPTRLSTTTVNPDGVDNDTELYTNYIPALHMLSMTTIAVANFYVKLSKFDKVAAAYDHRTYMTLIAEILVLVLELRIRKNEVTRGLIALLESKKSYVRYISHELRTPLNAAFLGLKLLTSEMKASEDLRDIERYDTLCDVNMSCTAAVSILDDLLCYEKLNSGILELHKEEVIIAPFLGECVSMFSAQARECGVTMSVVMDVTDVDTVNDTDTSSDMSTHLPLHSYDSIFFDKFKMDQVIRNLISNALKFTPKGGTMTITATFVPSGDFGTENVRRDLDTKKRPLSLSTLNLTNCWHRSQGATAASAKIQPKMNLATDAINGHLQVVVTDTGAGISMENQKRLFKDIVQFSPEKLQAGGGSGLGLWISGGIVDLHDGKISVHSEGEGMGSSFTVEIPMLRLPLSMHTQQHKGCTDLSEVIHDVHGADPTFDKKLDPLLERRTSLKPTSPPHIAPSNHLLSTTLSMVYDVLVVDDSRLNRKMLIKCLMKDGHICTEAEDGLEAIERVKERIDSSNGGRSEHFDAILMDFVMPNMDGPTATRQLRTMGYTGVIFGVTGNGLPSDIDFFLSCGANKVLLKPLNLESFGQAMEQIVTI